MCGCNQNRSSFPRGKGNLNRAVTTPQVCLRTLDEYKAIDTSNWLPHEQSLVKSQINVYHRNCNLYHDTIAALEIFYST